jgi:hypothetical protein
MEREAGHKVSVSKGNTSPFNPVVVTKPVSRLGASEATRCLKGIGDEIIENPLISRK